MSTIPPPWGKDSNWKPLPPGSHLFQPGQSGNPAGRTPGSLNKKTIAAQALHDASAEVAQAMIAAAKAGDVQAGKLVLDRVQPPLRPQAEKVKFDLDTAASATDQARQIMHAMAQGELDPVTGKLLLDCLGAYVGLRQSDELALRIEALEKELRDSRHGDAPGAVLQTGAPA